MAVSKTLWPSQKTKQSKERARLLRELLEIKEQSPIKNRTLRDSIEHFDERLDSWVENNAVNNNRVMDCIVHDWSAIGPGIKRESMFRVMNYGKMTYIFMGLEYDIEEMAVELGKLQKKVESYTRSGHRFGPRFTPMDNIF